MSISIDSNLVIPTLYIPSFHGDVRLERIDEATTRVIVAKATPQEVKALRELAEYATKKRWIEDTGVVTKVGDEGAFVMNAEIKKVQDRLKKLLKPTRDVVTVVKFSSGRVEEIVEAMTPATSASPGGGIGGGRAQAAREDKPVDDDAVKAAAAVAKPYRGCPAPDFVASELRANRALEAFLSPEQKEDFRKHNFFITVGAATGHRLAITSRHARTHLAKWQRTLFDLDDNVPLCVHDWDVPAGEEMLSIFLLSQIPEHELYMRKLESEVA